MKEESDARTHRTPKALRAKFRESVVLFREPLECARVRASCFGCISILCKYHAPIAGRYAEKVENCELIVESKARLAKVRQPRSLGRR